MKNYWVATKDAFIGWYITFPPISVIGVDGLLRFAGRVLDVGAAEGVYRLLETRSPDPFQADSRTSYLDHVVTVMDRTGILPLFSDGGGAAHAEDGVLRAPSRICYYDASGRVVEGDVENLGLLLKQLRPDKLDWGTIYMSQVPPVTIDGLTNIDIRMQRADDPIYFSIGLYSDIWFPRLMGLMDNVHAGSAPPTSLADLCDNRALALGHTPRLNRFLEVVHGIVEELGGEWEMAEPARYKYYDEMCRVDGIELNV